MAQSTYDARLGIILGITILVVVGLFSFPPIAQDPTYHDFADKRALLGIPDFGDVSSNLPFLIAGFMGLRFLLTRWKENSLFIQPSEKIIWLVFFIGITLVCFGSGYYHWEPDNTRLAWDRLPMTIAFMSLFAFFIAERIHYKTGFYLLPVLLLLGIGSVAYWHFTEQQGVGDLRLYALVQFFPMVAIPLICVLFPTRFTGMRFLLQALGWYILAKLFEHFDKAIFELLQTAVSGHTLKHLASGMAAYALFKYVKHRQKLPEQA